jgi:NAD(P)-dependent dehydrogenase (short-subunit alcohol dehydrogenase family)
LGAPLRSKWPKMRMSILSLLAATLNPWKKQNKCFPDRMITHVSILTFVSLLHGKTHWQNFKTTTLALDGVFANAGVGGENQYGISDRWDEIISINLTGTYVTIQELLPFIKKSNSDFKHIVITSSCLARFGVPNYTAYCTAKTGLLGLTKSLALELAPSKILVNAICPGWVETEMAKAGIQKLADRSGVAYERELHRTNVVCASKSHFATRGDWQIRSFFILRRTNFHHRASIRHQ